MAHRKRPDEEKVREMYTIRLTPMQQFAFDIASTIRQQSAQTFAENAIMHYADAEASRIGGKSWRHFWDESIPVAWLRVYSVDGINHDAHRASQRAFVLAHRQFFYERDGSVKRLHAETLWPAVETYEATWRKSKETNAWKVAEQMAEHLKKAGLLPPAYGYNSEHAK